MSTEKISFTLAPPKHTKVLKNILEDSDDDTQENSQQGEPHTEHTPVHTEPTHSPRERTVESKTTNHTTVPAKPNEIPKSMIHTAKIHNPTPKSTLNPKGVVVKKDETEPGPELNGKGYPMTSEKDLQSHYSRQLQAQHRITYAEENDEEEEEEGFGTKSSLEQVNKNHARKPGPPEPVSIKKEVQTKSKAQKQMPPSIQSETEDEHEQIQKPTPKAEKRQARPQPPKEPKKEPPKTPKKDTRFSTSHQPDPEKRIKPQIEPPSDNITEEDHFEIPADDDEDDNEIDGEVDEDSNLIHDSEQIQDGNEKLSRVSRATHAWQFFVKHWKPSVWENPKHAAHMMCKLIHILKGSNRAYKSYADAFRKTNNYPMNYDEFVNQRREERARATEQARKKKKREEERKKKAKLNQSQHSDEFEGSVDEVQDQPRKRVRNQEILSSQPKPLTQSKGQTTRPKPNPVPTNSKPQSRPNSNGHSQHIKPQSHQRPQTKHNSSQKGSVPRAPGSGNTPKHPTKNQKQNWGFERDDEFESSEEGTGGGSGMDEHSNDGFMDKLKFETYNDSTEDEEYE